MIKPTFDVPLYNVLLLSVGFLLLVASFGTLSSAATVMVQSINREYDVQWNASSALSITFVVIALANFAVPSILTILSARTCLALFSFLTGISFLTYLYPVRHALSIASVLIGFCVAVLYTAQNRSLIENSDSTTLNRNTGLYWAIHQCGVVFGSFYFYFQFSGVEEIKRADRTQTFVVFIGLIFLAAFIFLLTKTSVHDADVTEKRSSLAAFRRCFSIMARKEMLLLFVPFLYTGLQQSFLMNLFPNAMAYTKLFGADSVKLIGLLNVFCGLWEISGGALFALFGRFIKKNQKKVFIFAFALNAITFLLILLNHPNDSTIRPTDSPGIIEPRTWISIVCGVLLGLADCCFNSQLIALVGTIYEHSVDLSSAIALYHFLHALGASLLFFYASFGLTLHAHLAIMFAFSILNMASFCSVNSPRPPQLARLSN